MQNSELTDLESSVQALVRRAFELGRNDVLKRVVDVLKPEHGSSEPLALAAPKPAQNETTQDSPAAESERQIPDAAPAGDAPRPWYMRPIR